ncbi:uncharacterized protein [Euwallacea similis]|uniref:uncharacterized protein n=1 Tax=Euwallacea similis TaxID=1736056 RepID=UPI00344EDB89
MGGCRCSYKNCINTTKSLDNIHFFHYPVKHRERCVLWIENAGKPNFYDLDEEQLRNKVVCEMHFEDRWFVNTQKKRLLHGAVPTLDGDCNETVMGPSSPSEKDTPVYLPSNQYNDVKVVPANEDGTVFVLDTDNMFTISPKIESYIIKNGVLVPATANRTWPTSTNRPVKQPMSPQFKAEIATINTAPGSGPSKPLIKDKPMINEVFVKEEHDGELYKSTKKFENGLAKSHQMLSKQGIESQKSNLITATKQGLVQSHTKPNVAKNYLRQIKKHSRDIASIKRMLKQKRIVAPPTPDMKTILNELQQHDQIPPSLLTIISLLLGEKSDLKEDDIEFFTSLHKLSPDVYQYLSEKCKWNLPSVDVVVVDGQVE